MKYRPIIFLNVFFNSTISHQEIMKVTGEEPG